LSRLSLFRDRSALITGGASGIGRALGEELARRGALVTLADLDGEAAEEAARDIEERGSEAGGKARGVSLDVADAAAFEDLVAELWERHGGLDFLFNNAGIGLTAEVRDMDLAAWERVFDVNLRGVVHGVQAAYPRMVERGKGHVLNTACVAGLVPFPLTAAYCATKYAVVGMTTALRAEAAGLGVHVAVICPGPVATSIFDATRYIKVDKEAMLERVSGVLLPPETCARRILRGIERRRGIITVTGWARLTWWLYRLSPRLYDAITSRAWARLRPRLRRETPETTSE